MEDTVPQVAFYSYAFARTGYGTAARGYIHAFDAARIPFDIVSLDRVPRRQLNDPLVHAHMATGKRPFAPFLHLWHAEPHNAMRLQRHFARLAMLTTWETESLPVSYIDALNQTGEVWVPSEYNRRVFSSQLSVPVFRIPHPVNELAAPRFDALTFDREMEIPEGSFIATCIGTWQERKNLDGTIEAFLRAFPRQKDAYLILKTSFAFLDQKQARQQIAAAIARANPPDPAAAEKRIRIFYYPWPESCIASLLRRADCYLSLHRGEGWCYPLFDAASLGTPVVATGYSGPMDYLDEQHHRLVGYRMTAANKIQHKIRFAFDSSMSWAEPDLDHAAEHLRALYEDRAAARKLALEAATRIRREYSLEAVGQMARQRFIDLGAEVKRGNQEDAQDLAEYGSSRISAPALTTPGKVSPSPWAPSLCS